MTDSASDPTLPPKPAAEEVDPPTLPPREDLTRTQGYVESSTGSTQNPFAGLELATGTVKELPYKLGRYQLRKLLGKGGMGAVYLAHDTQLDRPVALKIPALATAGSHARERFLREAQAAATLSHPNLCPVFDVGTIDGVDYLTMAYIEGQPLSRLIRDGRSLPERTAAGLIRQLALAMQAAHDKGIIHRDLKPHNVMITPKKQPVIMDFGLARRNASSTDPQLTQSGHLMGTPAYMSPEQIDGDVKAMGPGCDIYSLGVILYQLLAGRLPFKSSSGLGSLVAQIVSDPPPPLGKFRSEISPDLEAICLRMLAKKPANRPSSMAEVAKQVDAFLRSAPKPAIPTTQDPARLVFAEMFQNPDDPSQASTERLPRTASSRPSSRTSMRLPSQAKKGFWQTRWPWVAGIGAAVMILFAPLILLISSSPIHGSLLIELSNPKAPVEVRVDGRLVEPAELAHPLDLEPGSHEVTVQGSGFEKTAEPVTIVAGRQIRLPISLKARRLAALPLPPVSPGIPDPAVKRDLLKNPGFEDTTLDEWTATVLGAKSLIELDKTIKHSGQQSLRVTATEPSDTALGQEIALKPGKWYRLTGWVKTSDLDPRGSNVYGTFQIHTSPGDVVISSGKSYGGNTDWTEVPITFQAPSVGVVRVCIFFVGFGQGTGTAWFDDLNLVETSEPTTPTVESPISPPNSTKPKGTESTAPVAVPTAAAVQTAREKIRLEFAEKYAWQSRTGWIALSENLHGQAQATKDDPIKQYALWQEARQMAIQAAASKLVLEICDYLSHAFTIDGLSIKASSLDEINQMLMTPSPAMSGDGLAGFNHHLAARALDLMDTCVGVQKFEMAFDLLQIAVAAESRANDGDIPLVQATAKEIQDLKPAFSRLQKNPDDPLANLQVGRSFCISEGRWTTGLPLLTKASDPLWVEAAKLELAHPTDAKGHVKAGDAWKAVWEHKQSKDLLGVAQRARAWYDLALSEVPAGERTPVAVKARQINGMPNLSLIKPFYDADAAKPDSGLPIHKFEKDYEWDSDYAKGRWFMRARGGHWMGAEITRFQAPFACQVIVRVVDPPTAAYDVLFGVFEKYSHTVRVDGAGAAKVLFFDEKSKSEQTIATHVPKSIKPHAGFDTLIIVGRKRQLDLYLNGLPILPRPVTLQHDIGPGGIHFGVVSGNTGRGHMEVKHITVWPAEGVLALGGRP